jgi:hypothetical protein
LTIGSQHLLSVPGRKTGELRSTPVSIATVDGNRYIVAAFLDAAWVRNVRVAGIGTLTRGRSCEDVRLTELSVGERGPVLRAFRKHAARCPLVSARTVDPCRPRGLIRGTMPRRTLDPIHWAWLPAALFSGIVGWLRYGPVVALLAAGAGLGFGLWLRYRARRG